MKCRLGSTAPKTLTYVAVSCLFREILLRNWQPPEKLIIKTLSVRIPSPRAAISSKIDNNTRSDASDFERSILYESKSFGPSRPAGNNGASIAQGVKLVNENISSR